MDRHSNSKRERASTLHSEPSRPSFGKDRDRETEMKGDAEREGERDKARQSDRPTDGEREGVTDAFKTEQAIVRVSTCHPGVVGLDFVVGL